jgi:DNA-binding transcriptional regulator YiaG
MSGKQSAKPRFGGVFFCPQKSPGLRLYRQNPAEQIKQIRERSHVSQSVFARYLNTSASTIKQWELGEKQPSGMALKLLSIVQKHGLEILA